MNILDQLAEAARQRVETAKQQLPPAEVKRQALALPMGGFRFEKRWQSRALPSSASAKRRRPPKGSSHRIFRTCKSPRNTRPPGRTPFRC